MIQPYIPSKAEVNRVHQTKDHFLNFIEQTLNKIGLPAKVMAVGSTAKDTFVSGDTDIDIFIVSPRYSEAYEHFSKIFKEGYRKEGPMNIWHFIHEGFDVDLVFIPPDHPRIDTLFHTEFMNRYLTEKHKSEAIRAKAFFKSQGVYGAEIGGIIGIAIEELIRLYNNLEQVCTVLSASREIPFLEDPADLKRTLLASINPIRWQQIKWACRKFLATSSFEYKRYDLNSYFAERKSWNHVTFDRLRDKAIDFHTALSMCNHAIHEIRGREPKIAGRCDASAFDQQIVISYQVSPSKLPKTFVRCGPPLSMKKEVEVFKAVHPNSFEQNGSICAIIERERTDVTEWVRDEITARMKDRGYRVTPL